MYIILFPFPSSKLMEQMESFIPHVFVESLQFATSCCRCCGTAKQVVVHIIMDGSTQQTNK